MATTRRTIAQAFGIVLSIIGFLTVAGQVIVTQPHDDTPKRLERLEPFEADWRIIAVGTTLMLVGIITLVWLGFRRK